MGFLTSLFGGETGSWWGVAFALIIVLVLIVAGLWVLKLLFNASGSVTRGRQRRLAVIDNLSIDGKHNLVLIRRDDVEHLVMIGGTQNLVVESGISNEPVEPVRAEKPSSSPRAAAPARANPSESTPAPEPEKNRSAAASRLGLSGLIRRYNTPADDGTADRDEPELTPLDRLKTLGKTDENANAPRLRHTGLLRPSRDEDDEFASQSSVENIDISDAEPTDSAKKKADDADSDAMASIEEGLAASNDDADAQSSEAAQTDDGDAKRDDENEGRRSH